MSRSSTFTGLGIAVAAALAFGMSGPFVKPLLEAGWSPAAAVTVRALVGGLVLAPFAVIALRGSWGALWRARSRIMAIGLIGVAATQLAYFAAIERISVGTGILIEFMAPLLLVAFVWARTRRTPKAVVLFGSVFALFGLGMVVSPGGDGSIDLLGLAFAAAAAVGCAIYFVAAARVDDDLPPVAVASVSLVLGGVVIGLVGQGRQNFHKLPLLLARQRSHRVAVERQPSAVFDRRGAFEADDPGEKARLVDHPGPPPRHPWLRGHQELAG